MQKARKGAYKPVLLHGHTTFPEVRGQTCCLELGQQATRLAEVSPRYSHGKVGLAETQGEAPTGSHKAWVVPSLSCRNEAARAAAGPAEALPSGLIGGACGAGWGVGALNIQ